MNVPSFTRIQQKVSASPALVRAAKRETSKAVRGISRAALARVPQCLVQDQGSLVLDEGLFEAAEKAASRRRIPTCLDIG